VEEITILKEVGIILKGEEIIILKGEGIIIHKEFQFNRKIKLLSCNLMGRCLRKMA
jgi:hypothetical protein